MHTRTTMVSLLGCFGGIACGADEAERDVDARPGDRTHAEPLAVCEGGALPAGVPGEFRHALSSWLALMPAVHAADDVIATTDGEGARIHAKLAYGPANKDLEDEWVEIRIDDCAGATRHLGFALTNGDGRLDFAIHDDALPEPGRHAVTLRVWGDGSTVGATLWVVAPQTSVAVFDIDGTLTTSDLELFEDLVHDLFAPILRGDVVPEARDGATELTWLRHDQGYLPVYLTGRPYWLTARTRSWLEDVEAPAGALKLAPSTSAAWPSNAGVGTYKAEALAELQLRGLDVAIAYGNASTDAFAYAEADVPRVFMTDTPSIGLDWLAHLQDAASEPDPPHPLTWP